VGIADKKSLLEISERIDLVSVRVLPGSATGACSTALIRGCQSLCHQPSYTLFDHAHVRDNGYAAAQSNSRPASELNRIRCLNSKSAVQSPVGQWHTQLKVFADFLVNQGETLLHDGMNRKAHLKL